MGGEGYRRCLGAQFRLFKTWYMRGLGIVKKPETLVLKKRDSEAGKIQRGPQEFKTMDSSATGVCKTEGGRLLKRVSERVTEVRYLYP